MKFQVHTFENGQSSVAWISDQSEPLESMHSSIGPWLEAHLIHLEQASFKERLNRGDSSPLVLFDIGFGIGTNSIAAFEAFVQGATRDLHIFSFETRLAGIRLALEQISSFPFLSPHVDIIRRLLKDGKWHHRTETGRNLQWTLLEGDFREKILTCPAPEIVFFDLFSPKHCPDLWGYESFRLLRESMKDSHPSSVVTTYSSSTAVRAALLHAGFSVGYGVSTDVKRDTTVASLSKETLRKPLDDAWFKKRLRSSRPNPHDLPAHLVESNLRESQPC